MNHRKLQLLLALAIGVIVAIWCYRIYSNFESRWNYLVWDPAAHGWDGMRLALDVRDFRILQLIDHTNHLVLWPPLHSYLQIPFFLLLGFEFQSAVICSLAFLALLPVALTWFYQQMESSWAGWIALMTFSATSPMVLAYGSMPMLEIFGAVLTAVAAALFLRRSQWFPIGLALIFFLKYNYFVYLLLPVLLVQAINIDRFRFVQMTRKLMPLIVMMMLFLLFAVLIILTGGMKLGDVSIRGIGNPAYILFLIMTLWVFWNRKKLEFWETVSHSNWRWFVFPVIAWLLIPVPNRVKTIVSFAINRPLGSPPPTSFDYYSYYFDTFSLYFAHHLIAWISVAILIAGLVLHRKKREVQLTASMFLLPFLLMTFNQNKQDRFLLTFVPAVWILVAYSICQIRNRNLRFAAALTICVTLAASFNPAFVEDLMSRQFAPLRLRPAIGFIARRIATAPEVRVIGATNELNPASIQYHSGAATAFRVDQHFDWTLEKEPLTALDIICIDCESEGKLLRSRTFKQDLVVRHYFLDTPDGAPYNPIQQ
jgi:hypothetical protein